MRTHRYAIFAVVGGSSLVYAMQFTTIAVALRDLLDDLDAPLRLSSWVLTVFMLGQVVSQPVAGQLAEVTGRRTVFLLGMAGFVAASFAAAAAPNILVLIVARAVQGFAGGAVMPAAMGIIGETWGEERARPIGLVSAVAPMGTVIGPAVGGILVEVVGWRGIFAINVPLGLVALVAAAIVLPRGEVRRKRAGRFDWAGLGLLTAASTSLVYGLTELGRDEGVQAVPVAVGLGMAVVLTALCLYREARAPEPIIALDLLRRRTFAVANTIAFWYGAALFGIASFIPLYAQEAYGLTDAVSGFLVTPRAVVVVTISGLSALFLARTGYRLFLVIGIAGFAAMLALLSLGLHEPGFGGAHLSNALWLAALSAGSGLFIGMVNPSLNNLGLHLEPARIPTIVGLRSMFQTLGGNLGIGVLVLLAARADTPGAGFELAFAILAGVLVVTAALAVLVPDLPAARPAVVAVSRRREADADP